MLSALVEYQWQQHVALGLSSRVVMIPSLLFHPNNPNVKSMAWMVEADIVDLQPVGLLAMIPVTKAEYHTSLSNPLNSQLHLYASLVRQI